MRFVFRPKPTNSLAQAVQLMEAARSIVRRHRQTQHFKPMPDDFKAVDLMIDVLNGTGDEVAHIRRQWMVKKGGRHE